MNATKPVITQTPLHVACPACGARPGVKCVTGSGATTRVHRKRLAAQSEENRRKLSEYVAGLDAHSFLSMAADSRHDWLCARETGTGECFCLCVVARQLLERLQ